MPPYLHPCERIYQIGAQGATFGNIKGICRITGKQATGLPFDKWVKDTFTDHGALLPGNIISNEALFCFEEKSEIIQKLTGRDKPQCFRTYTHIVANGRWYLLTKADKALMVQLITEHDLEIVVLSDSGQKHLLFKHRTGMWQLEEMQIMPNLPVFNHLHTNMMALLAMGFSQEEVKRGQYAPYKLMKADRDAWRRHENEIAPYRGKQIFIFTTWLMYSTQPQKP